MGWHRSRGNWLLQLVVIRYGDDDAGNRDDTYTRHERHWLIVMPYQFPVFEVALKKSGRKTWRWCICTTEGRVVMRGSESSRPAAKYYADRALFLLLLSARHQSIQDSPT
jgi:hypothetical protein